MMQFSSSLFRQMLLFGALVLLPAALLAEDGPLYKSEGMVGSPYPMDTELDLRVRGVLLSNHYLTKNEKGKVLENYEGLVAGEDSSLHFSISTVSKPSLKLVVSVKKENNEISMVLSAHSDKEKQKLKDQKFAIPWQDFKQANLNSLISELYDFSDKMDENIGFEVENLTGGAAPNYREMSLLALFITLKKQKPVKDKKQEVIYFNLLNYTFKAIDSSQK